MIENNDDLISKFVQGREPGAVITKYVVIAEGIDNDGDRAIYTATHTDATSWDVLGMLSYAEGREKAALTKLALEE